MPTSKLLLIIPLIMIFISCQKELSFEGGNIPVPTDSTQTESGTWNLISIQGTIASHIEFEESGMNMKVVSTGDFTTTNNQGTVTFEDPNLSFAGITYSVNTTAKATVYINDVLISNTDFPFSGTQPPTDDSGEYKKIDADSILVQTDVLSVLDPGNLQSDGVGFKLRWNGNQMTMTSRTQGIRDEEYLGRPVKAHVDVTAVLTFEKQ